MVKTEYYFIKIEATVKYMMRPVTSTRVATKGAEEDAGSAPSFFKTMGNMLPVRVPHNTTPIKEKQTDKPTSIPVQAINIFKNAPCH